MSRKDRRVSPASRRKAQSMQSTEQSRASSKSKSNPQKGTRGQLQWKELDDMVAEANNSSTDDEQKALSYRMSSRRSLPNTTSRSLPQVESLSSSSTSLRMRAVSEHAKPKHILKPPNMTELVLSKPSSLSSRVVLYTTSGPRKSRSCTSGARWRKTPVKSQLRNDCFPVEDD